MHSQVIAYSENEHEASDPIIVSTKKLSKFWVQILSIFKDVLCIIFFMFSLRVSASFQPHCDCCDRHHCSLQLATQPKE